MKQTTFASLAFKQEKKPLRRERLQAEMEAAIPSLALLTVEPRYPKSGSRNRQPMQLETVQQI